MPFRWLALAVFVAALAISGWRRRQAHRTSEAIPRSREPTGLIVGRLVVSLPLFGSVMLYLGNPAWMTWASFGLPMWARWLGVALGVLVVPSVYWVLTSLGTNVSETVLTKAHHRLVTSGPYRWVRHPLYTTGIALFASIGLMAANWFILLWSGVAAVALRVVVIPREEANLEAAFGDDYRRYRRHTGTIVPSLAGILARRSAD